MGRKFTEKDTKAFLRSITDFERKNVETEIQILQLRAVAESCTVTTDKDPVQSGGNDKMASIVGRIVDLEREIEGRKKIINHRRAEVEEIAKSMDNASHRAYMTIRYVEGNGFYDTLMKMDLSNSAAKRINRKSITEFTKRYNEKHTDHNI